MASYINAGNDRPLPAQLEFSPSLEEEPMDFSRSPAQMTRSPSPMITKKRKSKKPKKVCDVTDLEAMFTTIQVTMQELTELSQAVVEMAERGVNASSPKRKPVYAKPVEMIPLPKSPRLKKTKSTSPKRSTVPKNDITLEEIEDIKNDNPGMFDTEGCKDMKFRSRISNKCVAFNRKNVERELDDSIPSKPEPKRIRRLSYN